jgi:hypothetical protein
MVCLGSRGRTTFTELANVGILKIVNNVKHPRLKHIHKIFYNENPKFEKSLNSVGQQFHQHQQ